MKMKEEFSWGASKQTTPPSQPLHPDLHVALQLSKTVNPYTVFPSSVPFSHKHATFPGGSEGDASACSGEDPGLSLGLEDLLEKGWQGTPVFLPGESHGQRSLESYSPWGHRVRHNWATDTFIPPQRVCLDRNGRNHLAGTVCLDVSTVSGGRQTTVWHLFCKVCELGVFLCPSKARGRVKGKVLVVQSYPTLQPHRL